MPLKSYQNLVAWQKAMDLVIGVYELTRAFPKHEMYGLTGQVRRAAVSVPSNIAEGQGRGAGGDFAHHLRISRGSLQELETQVLIAGRLQYITRTQADDIMAQADEVSRLITGLSRSVV